MSFIIAFNCIFLIRFVFNINPIGFLLYSIVTCESGERKVVIHNNGCNAWLANCQKDERKIHLKRRINKEVSGKIISFKVKEIRKKEV